VKKILIYLVILLLLFNSAGYYFLYEVNKLLVRKEMEALMERNPTRLIVLKIFEPGRDPDFCRVDKHEIRYDGNLYDVLKETTKGRISFFYCIHDQKEQDLLTGFNKVSLEKLSQTLSDHLIKIALPVFSEDHNNSIAKKITFLFLKVDTTTCPLLPLTPPPELT